MRKSTKRLVSGILALSMLVTSMTVNPASVFAADYTSGSLTLMVSSILSS